MKKLAFTYASFVYQYNYKYHLIFSAKFNRYDEVGQKSDTVEVFVKLTVHPRLTQADNDNINFRWD